MTSHKSLKLARGFTLVELLVVIGIIALLISVLLPSLAKARRQAATVKCSSNMRQISLAILQYTQANKGRLMPCSVTRDNNLSSPATPANRKIWPEGWGWSNELVFQKYIGGPNNRPNGKVEFFGDSVFRCPEGLDTEFGGGSTSDSTAWPGATWPTNTSNNAYSVINSRYPRTDGQPSYATFTWYQLNARTSSSNENDITRNNPKRVSPFIQFVSSATDDVITGRGFTRNQSMVKKSSTLIMLAEAADPGWTQEGGFTGGDGKTWHLRRVGARHGRKEGPYNAYLNVAFFDGHVELQPSKKFLYEDPINWTEAGGMILYLNKQ